MGRTRSATETEVTYEDGRKGSIKATLGRGGGGCGATWDEGGGGMTDRRSATPSPRPPSRFSLRREYLRKEERGGEWLTSPVMELRNITLRFGGVTAISDISFDIREGEIRAIIGPNGAGKSSMLNVISGFYHPQAGEVWFRGERRPSIKPWQVARQGVARTFQNIALFEGMSVLDNVMTGRLTHMKAGLLAQAFWRGKAEREEIENRQKAEEVIDFLEIQHIRKTPVGRLPYGLKKRVELARALAAEPKILLLDEPMAGMNVEEKEDMSRYILDVNDEFGTTVVLIEHDMGVVMDLSDRVAVMDYGRLIGDGTPAEVRGNQDVIDAYLGVAHD